MSKQSLKAGTRIRMKTPGGDMGTIVRWTKASGPVNSSGTGDSGWHIVHFDLGGALKVHESAFEIEK